MGVIGVSCVITVAGVGRGREVGVVGGVSVDMGAATASLVDEDEVVDMGIEEWEVLVEAEKSGGGVGARAVPLGEICVTEEDGEVGSAIEVVVLNEELVLAFKS